MLLLQRNNPIKPLEIKSDKGLRYTCANFMAIEKLKTADLAWKAVLGKLELSIPRHSYETWLEDTKGISMTENVLDVETSSAFAASYLEERMLPVIESKIRETLSKDYKIRFIVRGQHNLFSNEKNITSTQTKENHNDSVFSLNNKYNFERFVIGDSNQLAYAAARAVAETPGTAFNPLVIYSDVGLGKTHLLHAIGNITRLKGLKTLYITSEQFTNQYVKAIQTNQTEKFRDDFRSLNVLLLDDIQFLAGKEQTQEGFFHTFNSLHLNNCQIVVACDRPIEELTVLQKRITSRLTGGLTVDVQPPLFETRLAILLAKCQELEFNLSPVITEYLAEANYGSIRELEGSLNKIMAWSQFTEEKMTLETCQSLLSQFRVNHKSALSDVDVIRAVSKHFDITTETLQGKKRNKVAVRSRQVAMFLLREETDLSLSAIGKILGGRDHSTILHGRDRVASLIDLNDSVIDDINKIKRSLHNKNI